MGPASIRSYTVTLIPPLISSRRLDVSSAVLGIEHRALCMLGKGTTTRVTSARIPSMNFESDLLSAVANHL